MLTFLDTLLTIFHLAIVLFNLFGWIPRGTRKVNFITILLTAASWFVAKDVKFVSRILGQKELPVENVSLKKITTGTVQEKKHIHENLKDFKSID